MFSLKISTSPKCKFLQVQFHLILTDNYSNSGGGKEKGEDGETKQVKDQDTSSIAIAFQRTMEAKMPVAIIAGKYCS